MRRPIKCLFAITTLASPIVAAFHAALFEYLTDYLISRQFNPTFAKLGVSLGITFMGMALFFSIGGTVWWICDSLVCRRVRLFYWDHVERLKDVLERYRTDLNDELGIYEKSKKPNTKRWQSLKVTCDTLLGGGNLFKTDIRIERHLRKNISALTLVRDLRMPVQIGLERVQEILGSGKKGINTIHRAEELVRDVMQHLEHLRERLSEV